VNRFKDIISKVWNDTFLYTLLAILIGFIVGALVLIITGFNPLHAYNVLFTGIFGSAKSLMFSVQYATPLILTGLAVTFAFKTGLFNIGAEGQYIMGGLAALLVGIGVNLPPVIHGIVCVIAGGIAGCAWGGIAGALKAYKGIHEVIVCIMLNWIAFYFSNFIVMSPGIKKMNSTASISVMETARINTDAFRASLGAVNMHWGMILAPLIVVLIWVILNKTTLGFKLKAVGFNRNAAEYGGISVGRSITVSMGISGALSGLAGAIQVVGVVGLITQLAAQEGYGFDGLAVSMIGGANPIGSFFAGLFYGGMKYGGSKLNTIGAPSELINVVIGVVIYSIAIMGAFRAITRFLKSRKEGAK